MAIYSWGFEVQRNVYVELCITVPLHLKPLSRVIESDMSYRAGLDKYNDTKELRTAHKVCYVKLIKIFYI